MAESTIPVDLRNPGQVFACLGFLEGADTLLGDAIGGFDWSDSAQAVFRMKAGGDENPFCTCLEFLGDRAVALRAVSPMNWWPADLPRESEEPKIARKIERTKSEIAEQIPSDAFPCRSPGTSTAMPVRICRTTGQAERSITLGHWADHESIRNPFKLYSGNRSALDILRAMIMGTETAQGIVQLWQSQRVELIERPFDVLTPMGGSFNFDPRGAWTARDAGYSLDEQKHRIAASPVVEVLAAWGMENARPHEYATRKVRYAVWGTRLPVMLARAALANDFNVKPTKQFSFELALSGKNKVTTFAREVVTRD